MDRYCCFWCPMDDYSEKSLEDRCPNCNRQYGLPIFGKPANISDYRVIDALNRGFYGVTYVVERGVLSAKSVLKVAPRVFYEYFQNKDFDMECRTHLRVAEGSDHIVGIRHMFQADVEFGNDAVTCNVAELDYVEGKPLAAYLQPDATPSAATVAQIAIDLFKIAEELRKKQVNHNDLHDRNIVIEDLPLDGIRADAIDGSIRAVAIDLGSVSDDSRSDSVTARLGDVHWIARHLDGLVGNLLGDPDEISDLDNRVASALDNITKRITPPGGESEACVMFRSDRGDSNGLSPEHSTLASVG